MKVRPGTSVDWPVVQDIERRAGERFREVGMPEIADDDPPTDADLADALEVLVAIDDAGELVGYAWLEPLGDGVHLEQLSVPPEHGGRGVATALLEAVASWACARGCPEVTLTTFRHVPFNAPFYERRGFAVVPEERWTPAIIDLVAREASHGLDPDRRVVMQRDLTQRR